MNKDYSQYPGLDWSGCLERTGNNSKLADELLEMFLKDVPKEVEAFKEAYAVKNYTALKDLAHRMRGALAYCVIPNLESALKLLEEAAAKEVREEVAKFYAVVMIQLKKFLPPEEDDNNKSAETVH
jgi:HPt (histidine-containing phosphotransfer) domain-containing protein